MRQIKFIFIVFYIPQQLRNFQSEEIMIGSKYIIETQGENSKHFEFKSKTKAFAFASKLMAEGFLIIMFRTDIQEYNFSK